MNSPYNSRAPRTFWRSAVAEGNVFSDCEIYDCRFPIDKHDKIATFGSCFAQHIGRHLRLSGFNVMDMEPAPPNIPRELQAEKGYGIYSGRYGNIYTALQFRQLYERSNGLIKLNEHWEKSGIFIDPFRPNIDPEGFATIQDLESERSRHLAAVNRIFQECDVIVLTLGLTEAWISTETGGCYPLAPGVIAGSYDEKQHEFKNLRYDEILRDLCFVIDALGPQKRFILTVSPVALAATFEDRHILVSNAHSKAILRAVAAELFSKYSNVDYFPSFEIITHPQARGIFYKQNLREVSEHGVSVVMEKFLRAHQSEIGGDNTTEAGDHCDEVLLEMMRFR